MFLMGDTQRSVSSTARGMVSGRALSRCHWSGCKSSCSIPPLITWRVVSSPPTRINRDSCTTSSSSKRSPSTSACTRTLMRSSGGLGPPGLDDLTGIGAVLREGGGGRQQLSLGHVPPLRTHHVVGPAQEVIAVVGRHAQHVADQDHGQRGRDVADEVALPLLTHAIDDGVTYPADLSLAVPHATGGESPVHELSPLPVGRVVH